MHLGVGCDAVRVAPRQGSQAMVWAVPYHVGASARFNISMYTLHGAMTLAHEYARKFQHFYDIYEAQPHVMGESPRDRGLLTTKARMTRSPRCWRS